MSQAQRPQKPASNSSSTKTGDDATKLVGAVQNLSIKTDDKALGKQPAGLARNLGSISAVGGIKDPSQITQPGPSAGVEARYVHQPHIRQPHRRQPGQGSSTTPGAPAPRAQAKQDQSPDSTNDKAGGLRDRNQAERNAAKAIKEEKPVQDLNDKKVDRDTMNLTKKAGDSTKAARVRSKDVQRSTPDV